jgi:hypothetical protein
MIQMGNLDDLNQNDTVSVSLMSDSPSSVRHQKGLKHSDNQVSSLNSKNKVSSGNLNQVVTSVS